MRNGEIYSLLMLKLSDMPTQVIFPSKSLRTGTARADKRIDCLIVSSCMASKIFDCSKAAGIELAADDRALMLATMSARMLA